METYRNSEEINYSITSHIDAYKVSKLMKTTFILKANVVESIVEDVETFAR